MGRLDRRLTWWTLLVAALAGLQYAGHASEGPPDRNILYHYSASIGSGIQYAIILALVLVIAGWSREVLALRRPPSWARALGLALLTFLVVWIAVGVLDHYLHGAREQGLTPTRWQPSHAGAYAASVVAVAGVGPVVEELTFRGLGYWLLSPFGPAVAIVVSGIAFGLYHGLVNALPELAIFGIVLAWLRWRTNSVYPGMLVHATFNALALVAVFFRH